MARSSRRRAERRLRLFVVALLLGLIPRAFAQTAGDSVELAVNGPEGALLFMDGQAMGRLPLAVNLMARPGEHRFGLEKGKQKGESAPLEVPASGPVELNLTLQPPTVMAFLRIPPVLLLVVSPPSLPAELTGRVSGAVAEGAKKELSILMSPARQAALLRQQPGLLRCLNGGDCHEPLLPQGQATYALSLHVDAAAPDAYQLRATLLDIRTRAISNQAEARCAPCGDAQLLPQIAELTSQVLNATSKLPRGSLAVTSVPAGAKVLIDGRFMGQTPLQQETFAGTHTVAVQQSGYTPYEQTVQVDQETTVQAPLQLLPRREPARPLWRIVSGSVALAGGVLLIGFGASAIAIDGRCEDPAQNPETCSPFFSTRTVGAGLIGAGVAVTLAGTLLLAIPSMKSKERKSARLQLVSGGPPAL